MTAMVSGWQTGVGGLAARLAISLISNVGGKAIGQLFSDPSACKVGEDRLFKAGLSVPKGTLSKWFSMPTTIETLSRLRPSAVDDFPDIENSELLDQASRSLQAVAGRKSSWTDGQAREALVFSLATVLSGDATLRGQVESHRVDVGVDKLLEGFRQLSEKLDRLLAESTADRERQILRWNQQALAMRSRADADRLYVTTPLDRALNAMMADHPWHLRIKNRLDELEGLVGEFDDLIPIVLDMQSLDLGGGYDAVVDGLRGPSRSLSIACRENLRRVRSTAVGAEREGEARRCAAASSRLVAELDLPTFGRALVVYGSWGSGRSRLVRTAIEVGLNRNHLCLVTEMTPGLTLEGTVIEWANSAFGDIHSLMDLNERLRDGAHGRCIVCFDDFHHWAAPQPGALPSLLSLIQRTSNLHSLYWLATFDEGHLDSLGLRREDHRAVADYTRPLGHSTKAGRALERESDGLRVLDKVNLESKLGLKILRQHAMSDRATVTEVPDDALPELVEESAILCNPRHAWLLSDAVPGSLDVADLHQDSFVTLWWSTRLHDLAGSKKVEAYRQLVDQLSLSFALCGGPVGELALINAVTSDQSSRHFISASEVRNAIDQLIEGGLLKEVRKGGEAQLRPHPTFPWGTLIGAALLSHYRGTDDHAAIDRWRECAGNGDSLAEAVGRAFLVLLDHSSHLGRDRLRSEWSKWFDQGGRATSAMWFAGRDATSRTQSYLPALAESRRSNTQPLVRELMAQISFACHVDHTGESLARVLRLIQPNYQLVGDHGLGGYLSYALHQQLVRSSLQRSDVSPVLLALAGTESAEQARTAASHAAAATERVFAGDWSAISEAVISWASQAGTAKHYKLFPSADGGQAPFWSCFLRQICDRHSTAEGTASLTRLRNLGWYRLGDGTEKAAKWSLGRVALTMEMQANQSLAAWYRDHGDPEYIKRVNELARSTEWHDLKTAYYLIRHSVPVGEGEAALVSPLFNSAWTPLVAAHRRKPIAPTLPGDAEVNLGRSSAE